MSLFDTILLEKEIERLRVENEALRRSQAPLRLAYRETSHQLCLDVCNPEVRVSVRVNVAYPNHEFCDVIVHASDSPLRVNFKNACHSSNPLKALVFSDEGPRDYHTPVAAGDSDDLALTFKTKSQALVFFRACAEALKKFGG